MTIWLLPDQNSCCFESVAIEREPVQIKNSTDAFMLKSVLQGKDLHARLTNPRGSVISSSVLLEKSKLEEEVKQLQGKIAELEW